MSLEEIARHSLVTLNWVPRHRDIPGNCMADSLAYAGTTLNRDGSTYNVGVSLPRSKQLIAHKFHIIASQRGLVETTCGETRKIWPIIDEKRTRRALQLSRHHLRKLIAVITGH